MEYSKSLISVIMPAYNAERTIGRAIDSIMIQTYSYFELIIVNDGSQDSTLNICKKYKDERIQIVTQKNGGLSAARNKGLIQSKGKYVCFIDSDDWYESNYLEKMLCAIESSQVDLSVCNIICHKKNGISVSYAIETAKYNQIFDDAHFLRLFECGIMNSTCNKLYKKEIIDNWHLLFFKKTIMEDIDFNLRYLSYAKSVYIMKDALYNYDQTSSILTTKVSEAMFDNYMSLHAYFLSLVKSPFYKLVSQFVYHQYLSLTLRFINEVRVKRLKKKDVYYILDKVLNNVLVNHSIRSYHPRKIKELLTYCLFRFRCYGSLLLLSKITNRK